MSAVRITFSYYVCRFFFRAKQLHNTFYENTEFRNYSTLAVCNRYTYKMAIPQKSLTDLHCPTCQRYNSLVDLHATHVSPPLKMPLLTYCLTDILTTSDYRQVILGDEEGASAYGENNLVVVTGKGKHATGNYI